jgi:hypothetical protein
MYSIQYLFPKWAKFGQYFLGQDWYRIAPYGFWRLPGLHLVPYVENNDSWGQKKRNCTPPTQNQGGERILFEELIDAVLAKATRDAFMGETCKQTNHLIKGDVPCRCFFLAVLTEHSISSLLIELLVFSTI